MIESPKKEVREKPSPREILLQLEATGEYVFHGSPTRMNQLEPRQADQFNVQTGQAEKHGEPSVSATPYAETAIFRALTHSSHFDPHEYFTTFGIDPKSGTLSFSVNQYVRDRLSKNIGYVYIFKKSDFQKFDDMEMRSSESMKPIGLIKVAFDDLPKNISTSTKGD